MSEVEWILKALNEHIREQDSLINYYRKELEAALAAIEEMKADKTEEK